jgi:hypothetical protein
MLSIWWSLAQARAVDLLVARAEARELLEPHRDFQLHHRLITQLLSAQAVVVRLHKAQMELTLFLAQ